MLPEPPPPRRLSDKPGHDEELARRDAEMRERRLDRELAQRDAREKAQGETLVSEYEERLAVRQKRDEIDRRGQRHLGDGVFTEAPLSAEELRKRGETAGRQTSPELASLASEYMTHDDPNVRRLAASVLSQASEE